VTPALLVLAAAKVALHLVLAERYGYTDEELYVLACSDHLDWGYVGVAPLASHVAFAARIIFGSSLVGIRILPALAGGALVLATGLLARRLGGGRFAVLLAGLSAAVAPALLAAPGTLGPDVFAALAWTLVAGVVAGADARGGRLPLLLFVPALVLAVLAAPALIVFAATLPVALMLTWSTARRGAFVAAALSLLALLPAIHWQIAHAWPLGEMLGQHLSRDVQAQLFAMVATTHVSTVPLWLGGALALIVLPRLAAGRALGVAFLATAAVLVEFRGEPRLLVPLLPLLFAAGAVAVEAIGGVPGMGWLRSASVVVVAGAGLLCAPLLLPILPLESVPAYASAVAPALSWPQEPAAPGLPERFTRMLGWPQLVRAAGRALDAVPLADREKTAVWARTRWQAAAIDRLGERYGLRRPISGDGSYRFWGPGEFDAASVIVVGYDAAELQPWFRSVRSIETVVCAACPPSRRRVEVHVASDPRLPAEELWRKAILAGP
jgi:hypothetical protein